MNWKKRFVSQKLNVKFTLVIILFMVIPIGILAGILFYRIVLVCSASVILTSQAI